MRELPRGWRDTTIGEVGTVLNGDRGQNYPSREHYISSGVPFISAGNIQNGILDLSTLNHISVEKFETLRAGKLVTGDILYCLRGSLGKCAVYTRPGEAAIASSLAILRLGPSATVPFVFYYLQSPAGVGEIGRFDNGTAQPNLSARSFAGFKIPLPPLSEQVRIVAKLDELFSDLDAGVASLNQARAQLKVYRQAVLKRAFEGRLVGGKEREIHRGGAENAEGGVELPAGWRWAPISQLVKKMDQGWSPKCENIPSDSDADWAVIRTTAIQHGQFDPTQNKVLPNEMKPRMQHELVENDILITRAGPRTRVGVCCLVKKVRRRLINCDKAYRIKVDMDAVNPVYLTAALNAPQFLEIIETCKSGGSDSGLNLTQGVFLSIPLPLPPLDEQQAIVSEIERRFSVADVLEATLDQSLARAEALRQSLLQKAFRGELVPQETVDA